MYDVTRATELVNYFALVPELKRCRKIIVCDGVKVGEATKFRQGRVTDEAAAKYAEYIRNLRTLAAEGCGEFANAEVVALEKRGGFGLAVKAALSLMYVCLASTFVSCEREGTAGIVRA